MTHKILVCGSRKFGNFEYWREDYGAEVARQIYERHWNLCRRYMDFYLQHILHEGVVIIHGGAKGADTLADRYSREVLGQQPIIFLPDWNKLGKKAGFARNSQMINVADLVVAFWDGESRGTKDSIDKAYASDTVQDVKIVRWDKKLGAK